MMRRFSLLACLVAALSAFAAPALAYAAPLPTSSARMPASHASAPAVVLATPPGQAPLTAQEVTVSTPDGQALTGLRVRSGPTDVFTVLCRAWEAQPGAGALGAPGTSWFYSDRPVAAAALDLARRLPMVGHACAVTRDPSPANVARLALDVVTVIVFIQTVGHALPAITGVAVAITHAPGALAAAGILLEQGPGIVATIRGGMDQVQRLNNLGDEMQARLRAGAAGQVTRPHELSGAGGLAQEPTGLRAAPPEAPGASRAPNNVDILATTGAAGAAALGAASQGIAGAGQVLRTTGQALWQRARSAGSQTASAATDTRQRLGASLQNLCLDLPFAHIGCPASPVTAN